MKTVKITVQGYTHISSKKTNKEYTVLHYTYLNGRDGTTGSDVGSLWIEGTEQPVIGAELDGVLGYDRFGNYGVVDII